MRGAGGGARSRAYGQSEGPGGRPERSGQPSMNIRNWIGGEGGACPAACTVSALYPPRTFVAPGCAPAPGV